MKRWHIAAAAIITSLPLLLLPGSALAQGFEQLPPAAASVITKTAFIIDQVLGRWVLGNSLTDPQGQELVTALAQAAVHTVHFLAQLVTMF